MTRGFLVMIVALLLAVPLAPARAQETSWVQIEAQPSLARAKQSARQYAAELEDVNGFSMGGGWYAIALGPYSAQDARQVLRVYRSERVIPRDSYITQSADYRSQFWPVGEDDLAQNGQTAAPDSAQQAATEPAPRAPEETRQQARASERELSRRERKDLQIALQWAGHYDGRIDAAFGPRTRGAMADWQEANNYERTGILTTRQRAELLRQYNAVLDGLGLEPVRDDTAGIEVKLPTEVVAFEKYEPPFAHYPATGEIAARVLLISQEGDENTLGGLFDIMQTLEIVPPEGPRELNSRTFTLVGRDEDRVSHTEARLEDGRIKGFTLVWPAGDEDRRTRLLDAMQDSFRRIDGVLPASAGEGAAQSIDLVAGLRVRQPEMSRSGFYVDRAGTVVTTAQVVRGCERITIDGDYEAEVVATGPELGVAVLRPKEPLAPLNVASFQKDAPRLQSEVAVAGYSYGGLLGAPTLTFGQLADMTGLNGEENLKRLALAALEGDVGGPVVDAGGAVLGMLLPGDTGARTYPEGVSFAADAAAIRDLLEEAGISPAATSEQTRIAAETLTDRATRMTVLVSCWE